MSSTDVPWPGSRGSSTAKPAAASASATPRIDDGVPVKPWSTSAPWGPPGAEKGSAEGRSGIGVLRPAGQPPPRLGGGGPFRVGHDAVDGAGGQALVAAAAQLGHDDDVDAVVEDGAELGWAGPQAGVAVDADRHVDAQRRRLPLGVAAAGGEPLGSPGHDSRGRTSPGPGARRPGAPPTPPPRRPTTGWRWPRRSGRPG